MSKRSTIQELEAILNDEHAPAVNILPNGELTTMTFQEELERLINRYSRENGSNTPDFILAEYLAACLKVFDAAVGKRETWYGRNARLGPGDQLTEPSPIP